MQLVYHLDVSGPQARFDQIAKGAGDPMPILKRWGGYFKKRTLARAATLSPPLAASTQNKYEQTRTDHVTAAGSVRKSYGGALERHLIRQQKIAEAKEQFAFATDRGAKALSNTSSVREAAKSNPSADLQELRRLQAGGAVERATTKRGKPGKPVKWQGSKAIDRLRKRLAKSQDKKHDQSISTGPDKRKSHGHQLLGRVARQIQWNVAGAAVSVFSKVPWSAVHNEGGPAGNGATEPKREFLSIGEEDPIVLSKIALEHFLGPSA